MQILPMSWWMLFERLPPLIDLALRPSRMLTGLLAGFYGAAIIAALANGLPLIVRVLLALVLGGVGGFWILSHAVRYSSSSVERFVWHPEGECVLIDRRGRTFSGRIEPGAWVSPGLVVLQIRGSTWRRRALVVAYDAVDPTAFRRLRMRLRISPPSSSGMVRKLLHRLPKHR